MAGSARTMRTIQARGQLSRHHSGPCPRDDADEADLALGFPDGSGGGGWSTHLVIDYQRGTCGGPLLDPSSALPSSDSGIAATSHGIPHDHSTLGGE